MQTDMFIASLKEDGFNDPVTVSREPNGIMEEHSHEFEAKALILEGELSIRASAGEMLYQTGDVFHLAANTPNSERYGPSGVRYLVGRKTP
jgi:quercetin dioxygenase-like cupin family protein